MKRELQVITLMLAMVLSGCAGLSQKDKAELAALKSYQKADAKVERKVIKLGVATALSAAALNGVVESTKELNDAKKQSNQAKEELKKELGLKS